MPQVVIAVEHYAASSEPSRRTAGHDRGRYVNTFHDDTSSFNVVAEIPGADKADEVVMLGAHSIHGMVGPAPPTTPQAPR